LKTSLWFGIQFRSAYLKLFLSSVIAVFAVNSQIWADEAPQNRPPDITAGTFVPQLNLLATSETGTDKTQLSNSSAELKSDGTATDVANVDDGWPANGSGAARAKMSVICTKPTSL